MMSEQLAITSSSCGLVTRLCSFLAWFGLCRFVVTSATIANPLEHSALLLGVERDELLLVAEDGSPHGPKDVVLWNPPLTAMVSCLTERNHHHGRLNQTWPVFAWT